MDYMTISKESIKDIDISWFKLLSILADGNAYTKEYLLEASGDMSYYFQENIKKIIEIFHIKLTINGDTYQIHKPLSLLSYEKIRSALPEEINKKITDIHIFPRIDSTNIFANTITNVRQHTGEVVLAEHQTAGRGRGDRKWVSPFGRNIYFSLRWSFESTPQALPAYSLVVGLAVSKTLEEIGLKNIGIKWPNDVLINEKKISGILIENRVHVGDNTDINMPPTLTIGIGINVDMDIDQGITIDREWTDITKELEDFNIDRNSIISKLIFNIINMSIKFEKEGFDIFKNEFSKFDIAKDRSINISKKLDNSSIVNGICRGINSEGGIIIETKEDGIQEFYGGEISLTIFD